MSLYFFIQKFSAAISVGIALPVASWMGFNPPVIDSSTSFVGLKFVSVVLPGLISAPALLLLFNYPIDEKRHALIRQEL